MRSNKSYTEEEKLFLESEWGKTSTEVIARKLNRTEEAIKEKAFKMGLGPMLDNKDFLIASEVCNIIGTNRKTLSKHISERGLKARGKSLTKDKKVISIKYEDLIKWLEKNPSYWNATKSDNLTLELLGMNKFFLEKKIKEDTKELEMTTLSDKEVEVLKELYKKFYTYEQIANRMCKKYSTVKWKIHTLIEQGELIPNTKEGRLVRSINRGSKYGWSKSQDEELIRLYREGKSLKEISEIVGKSLSATKTRNRTLSIRLMNNLAI